MKLADMKLGDSVEFADNWREPVWEPGVVVEIWIAHSSSERVRIRQPDGTETVVGSHQVRERRGLDRGGSV